MDKPVNIRYPLALATPELLCWSEHREQSDLNTRDKGLKSTQLFYVLFSGISELSSLQV